MATKNVNKTRLLMKHDIEANWLKAENFIPLEGEIVVYDADETHSRPRMKIGDGKTKVGALSFVSPETTKPYMQLVTNADGETIWEARTHYIEEVVILPETSFIESDISENGILLTTPFILEEGKEYAVLYNGTKYTSTAIVISRNADSDGDGIADFDGLCLGNPSPFGEEDNGLPFVLMGTSNGHVIDTDPNSGLNVYAVFIPLDGTTSGSFSLIGGQAKKLDPQFYDAADWAANEGEAGYIKNRTHYDGEYIEYLPETEIELLDLGGFYAYEGTIPLGKIAEIELDKEYTITYDGVNYNYKFSEFESGIVAGNTTLLTGQGSDDPILIGFQSITDQDCSLIFADMEATESKTVKIKISNEENRTVKLDKKFLPDGLFYMEQTDSVEIGRGTTDTTYEGSLETTASLEENKEYIVIIQGKEYSAKCKKYVVQEQNRSLLYLGNFSRVGLPDIEDTGEPFLIGEEGGELYYNYDPSLGYGEDIIVKIAPVCSKIPFQHLPTPNWSAKKGEEGYIENKTHYFIPGWHVLWDGITEGKETTTLQDMTFYKISDTFIDFEQAENVIVTNLNDNSSNIALPLFTTLNLKNILLSGGPAFVLCCQESGNLTFLPGEGLNSEPFAITVPSPGTYFYSPFSPDINFSVDVEDEIKKLDSIYLPDDIGSNIELDTTLSIAGAAADAKAVGDAIANIEIPSVEGLATETYVDSAVANLVDSSPDTLNTLNELANALGDDPNFATTMTTELGKKSTATNIVNGINSGSLRTILAKAENDTYHLGTGAFSEGDNTEASGNYSHAEGASTKASGSDSHAEGYAVKSVGAQSHAEGRTSIAFGQGSHAEGNSVTIGLGSHAEGFSNSNLPIKITGEANSLTYSYTSNYRFSALSPYKNSFIKYNNNYIQITDLTENTITLKSTLDSNNALSETTVGIQTCGSFGQYSHTEGYATETFGDYSHAEGRYTSTFGLAAHAEGYYTVANGDYQHVAGKNNIIDENGDYAYIVGNGSSASRSNAHTLNWDGTAWYAKDVYVGGTGQFDEAAEKLLKQSDLEAIAATDDEIMELMASLDMLSVVTDAEGAILTDENSNILLV